VYDDDENIRLILLTGKPGASLATVDIDPRDLEALCQRVQIIRESWPGGVRSRSASARCRAPWPLSSVSPSYPADLKAQKYRAG
jgi:hypothetical protein